jgi:molecular chaperone GrpE
MNESDVESDLPEEEGMSASAAAEADADDALPENEVAGSRGRAGSPLEAERDQYKEMAQRIQADFENFKKRVVKQEQERVARAEEGLVVKLLPVLDTLDLALAHEPNGSLEQVRTSLVETLQKAGLERVADTGEPFDPAVHEAVSHEPGEGEQRVASVMRAGYRWNGRVIRPAMVSVTGG